MTDCQRDRVRQNDILTKRQAFKGEVGLSNGEIRAKDSKRKQKSERTQDSAEKSYLRGNICSFFRRNYTQ